MNKLWLWVKSVLLLLVISISIYCAIIYDALELGIFILYMVLLILYFIINIRDIFKNTKYKKDIKYNIISSIMLLIIVLIYIRGNIDSNFILDSSYSADYSVCTSCHPYIAMYLSQNLIYYVIMISSLILYRLVNIDYSSVNYKNFKYSILSIICLAISIDSVIPVVDMFRNCNPSIPTLILTVVLIAVEIEELIRNNHKKKEWIIYLSFVFNLLAIIIFYNALVAN